MPISSNMLPQIAPAVRHPPSKIPLLDLYYFLKIFQVEPDLLGKRNDLC